MGLRSLHHAPGLTRLAAPPAGYVPGLGRKPRAGHRVSWQRRCEWAKRTSPPHAAPRPHLLPRSVREGRSAACRGRGPDRTGWALSPDPLPQWRVADVLATAIQRKPGEDRGAGTAPHAVPPRGTRALRLWMRPSRCGPSPLPQRGAVWVTRHFPGRTPHSTSSVLHHPPCPFFSVSDPLQKVGMRSER